MHTTRLAGTLSIAPSPRGDDLRKVPSHVDLLEVRIDRTGPIDPDWLRSHFRGQLLFTLRSTAEGGRCDAALEERHRRLRLAATHYDLIDLEADRDLLPNLLARIPAERRLISWSGRASDALTLARRVQAMTTVPARLYRVVPTAARSLDGLALLEVVRKIRRNDLIAYADGAAGFWSRLIAPHVAAPYVFGTIGTDLRSLREPPVTQLIQDYGIPLAPPPDRLFGIVGSPVTHSLSALLHNTAYRTLDMSALFVPFEEEQFDRFWRDMVDGDPLGRLGVPLKGLTVVSPHKEVALETGAQASEMVHRAGATNILIRNGRGWRAETTDPEGVVVALHERGIDVRRQKVAVIGCGGAGRAVASALDLLGAGVTLVNRGLERGTRAQQRLRLPFVPLDRFSPRGYSTIVNATPVGRDGDSLPFDVADMERDGTVIDLTYGRDETPLIRKARGLGFTFVDGHEVCLIQVRRQFRLMTGRHMPPPAAERQEVAVALSSSSR